MKTTPTTGGEAMDDTNKLSEERARYEAKFPMPVGVEWIGEGYEVEDSYANSYACDRYIARWIGWLAAKADTPPVALPAVVDAEAQLTYALDLLDWLRGYPDFSDTGAEQGIVRTAIEEVFAGKRPSMLVACDYLSQGLRPPASESLQAMADNERELGLGYETGASEELRNAAKAAVDRWYNGRLLNEGDEAQTVEDLMYKLRAALSKPAGQGDGEGGGLSACSVCGRPADEGSCGEDCEMEREEPPELPKSTQLGGGVIRNDQLVLSFATFEQAARFEAWLLGEHMTRAARKPSTEGGANG